MSHEMIQVQGVWECVSCPRRLVFTTDAEPLVLTPGNASIVHVGRVGDAPILGMRRS